MRLYKVTFLSGLAAGFVLGTRAGRERYDQMRRLAKSATENPAFQQAAGALNARLNATMKSGWNQVVSAGRHRATMIRERTHGSGQSAPAGPTENGDAHRPGRGNRHPFVPVDGESGDRGLS